MQLPFPGDAAPLGTPPAEDCLYANVWRPVGGGHRLPVVVWIYGGGFVNGGASPPTYSGANMARQGVVFMSFNYRLGRFGTFAHPQLSHENADGGLLGNYGAMDQLAALKWVQRNIGAFGGDPGNVTIIGESAGGMSIITLLTSPLTDGLFARAVVMSGGDGGPLDPASTTLAAAEQRGLAFAQNHGIAADDPQALAKLWALPAETVVDGLNLAQLFRKPTDYSAPFVDGKLAVDARAAFASGQFHKVPVMIGATSADIGGKSGMMVAGARAIAGMIADAGGSAYEYRFSYAAESLHVSGAGHASDIPYFFANVAIKYGNKTTARDITMGETISRYIVNFARRGDPNGPDLPRWPRFSRDSDQIMDFTGDGQAQPQSDPWAQ